MSVTRLALLDSNGTVLNVIDAPEGVGADWPNAVLGLPGEWVVDLDGTAGFESVYVREAAMFFPPTPDEGGPCVLDEETGSLAPEVAIE